MNYKKGKQKIKSKLKKRNKKVTEEKSHGIAKLLVAGTIALVVFLIFSVGKKAPSEQGGVQGAYNNYGREVKKLSRQFDLSPSYLMALIMLECSGVSNVPPRFEKHVFNKLKDVRAKKVSDLENISYNEISNASDDALRNLASSWGPFQLMGYKCIHLGITIKDLRGDNSLYYGVKWINDTYGDYIRKGRYADAFHIHNTGHPVPKNGKYKTYDKNYVPRGLEYMKEFDKLFND
ncbi:MAG: hypothetical protein IKS00_08465 [Bacteroidales bacterium]|nr:hypothetical protein [Bacteroidales bacterium]